MNARRLIQIEELLTQWSLEVREQEKGPGGLSILKGFVEEALIDDSDESIIKIKNWIRAHRLKKIKEDRLKKMNLKVEIVDNKIKILPR